LELGALRDIGVDRLRLLAKQLIVFPLDTVMALALDDVQHCQGGGGSELRTALELGNIALVTLSRRTNAASFMLARLRSAQLSSAVRTVGCRGA
jgi:hypothetical protein